MPRNILMTTTSYFLDSHKQRKDGSPMPLELVRNDIKKMQKPVSRQLTANPKAEICAFHNGTWVRIAGELVEDDRVEARKPMLDAYPNLRKMYDENDGNTQVFCFKNATATFCSFTAAPETIKF